MYFDHPYEPDPEERGFYWAPRSVPKGTALCLLSPKNIDAIILKHKNISTTGVTKVVICAILTVGWCIL